MPELLSMQQFMEATETELLLPAAIAAKLGRPTLKVRVIDGARFGCFFPPMPPEVAEGDSKELQARERAWLLTLPAPERIKYRIEVESVKFHVLALAALEPRMTFEEAERFGDAVDDLYSGILRFSGLLKETTAPVAAPVSEPAEVAGAQPLPA